MRRFLTYSGLMDHHDPSPASEASDASEPLQPDAVETPEEAVGEGDGTYISEPSKLIRIASMTRAMLDEVRQTPLDEAGKERLSEVYHASLGQLKEVLSDDLQEELSSMFQPLEGDSVTEAELRIVQAQLVGWLEGLFHGIQATLMSQQMSANAQLQEMSRRRALEGGDPDSPGMYL